MGLLKKKHQSFLSLLLCLQLIFIVVIFCTGVSRPSDSFHVSLIEENEEQKEIIQNRCPGSERTVLLGASLRTPFQNIAKESRASKLNELKHNHAIGDEDQIGMISMGAQGGAAIKDYCKRLFEGREALGISQKLHVFVLCGSNQALKDEIDQAAYPSDQIVFHTLGWTGPEEIAALMSESKFYVTKPGGMSTAEAIALNTPILFDGKTAEASPWEPYNMQRAEAMGIGEKVVSDRFIDQVKGLLNREDPVVVEEFAGRDFNRNIVDHVDNQCS